MGGLGGRNGQEIEFFYGCPEAEMSVRCQKDIGYESEVQEGPQGEKNQEPPAQRQPGAGGEEETEETNLASQRRREKARLLPPRESEKRDCFEKEWTTLSPRQERNKGVVATCSRTSQVAS